jgi:hypothetical protein
MASGRLVISKQIQAFLLGFIWIYLDFAWAKPRTRRVGLTALAREGG